MQGVVKSYDPASGNGSVVADMELPAKSTVNKKAYTAALDAFATTGT